MAGGYEEGMKKQQRAVWLPPHSLRPTAFSQTRAMEYRDIQCANPCHSLVNIKYWPQV